MRAGAIQDGIAQLGVCARFSAVLVWTDCDMKYCIGCVHCVFEGGSRGYHSTVTHDDSEDAKLYCAVAHWRVEMHETTQAEFAKFMESAETCADYVERPIPNNNISSSFEIAFTITVGAAMRRGVWTELCALKGLNPWAVNDGLTSEGDVIQLTAEEARSLGIQL
jgi:hypothetical protein